MLTQRASGLLLHPTCLSGGFGIGDLGPGARQFIDFLARAGQSYWQLLPLGPTGYGNSPYSTFSAFAGNPLLISPAELLAVGDLQAADLGQWEKTTPCTDYSWAERSRRDLLRRASGNFFKTAPDPRHRDFDRFCQQQAFWLNDYAIFRSLHTEFEDRSWTDWPQPIRDRQPAALDSCQRRCAEAIREQKYQQFIFFEQWQAVRDYAHQKGVHLFGDLPIFVALDSSDVWCNREQFLLDEQGHPSLVAGVPPDYFSQTGQRWGNPLYRWEQMEKGGFSWWKNRLNWNLQLFDLLRIDHFRGFEGSWAIPAEASSATAGSWRKGPGNRLFEALYEADDQLPLVAEDLGVLTDEVVALRDRWGLPGMNILQFAFDSDHTNPYLPDNHAVNSVVYTGTHDNDTSLGWWQGLNGQDRERVRRDLGTDCRQMPQDLIRSALASVARLAIIPVQDLLGLPSAARMNCPGKPSDNWTWRLPEDILTRELGNWLRAECQRAGRTVPGP